MFVILGILVLLIAVQFKIFPEKKEEEAENLAFSEIDFDGAILLSEHLFGQYSEAMSLLKALNEKEISTAILLDGPKKKKEMDQWKKKLVALNSDFISFIPVAHSSYWVRDFSPIPTSDRRGGLGLYLADFTFRSESQIDDLTSYQLGLYLKSNLVHVPLFMEGGNFISNGKDCILTDDIDLEEKQISHNKFETITDHLEKYLGCKRSIILKAAPHEHVDMFAKFVSKNTLLINEISTKQIKKYSKQMSPKDLNLTYISMQQLNNIAKELAREFKIIRVPMPIIESGIFRTYTNSLIVKRNVFIPSYKINHHKDKPYLDSPDLGKIEEEVANIYRVFELKVRFLNSDETISRGGALHCITANTLSEKSKTNM